MDNFGKQMVLSPPKNAFSKLNSEHQSAIQSSNDVDILLGSLIRILKPPSPQPVNRQIYFLYRYVQLLNRHPRESPICIDWIQPFVDLQEIATFHGLGLTNLIHSFSNQDKFLVANFQGDSPPHPVFPSNGLHLRVWDELLEYAKIGIDGCLPPPTLFCNQHTENRQNSLLASEEPFIVRLRLQNPFPFPLIIRELRLSVDKVMKNGVIMDQCECYQHFEIPFQNIELPGSSNEIVDWQVDDGKTPNFPSSSSKTLDLRVIPHLGVEFFEVNGIQFKLCVPPLPGNEREDEVLESTKVFVPMQIKGRRLFNTKEQCMSKQYSIDNRLRTIVQQNSSPLLAFRPTGGDSNLINATTENVSIEAYADQILQIVFEVENIGKVPVNKMVICSNLPEQVSISEPNLILTTDRWSSCSVNTRQSSFATEPFPLEPELEGAIQLGTFSCKFISTEKPLQIGHKTGIRIAIRVWPEIQSKNECQHFYFLILYSSDTGQSRQFRFAARIHCIQSFVSFSIRQLNPSIGLNALNLKTASSAQIKLELLRLSAIFCESKKIDEKATQHEAQIEQRAEVHWKGECALRALINKQIMVEGDQSLSLCFLATVLPPQSDASSSSSICQTTKDPIQWNELWLSQPKIPDIPIWHLALSKNGNSKAQKVGESDLAEGKQILLMKILWKAYMVQKDGTFGTIFGETLLSSDEEDL